MQEMQHDAGEAARSSLLLTTRDVQRLIKVDRSTIYRMAESGRIPAVKVGRQWRFPASRLRDWLHNGGGTLPGSRPAAGELPALAGSGAVQAVADLLAESTGTMVVVTDLAGMLLAEVARPCGLFRALHAYPGVMEHCVRGWEQMAAGLDLAPRWQPTPLGFLCARSLFRVGDRLGGMVLAGGVAPETWPPPPTESRQLAEALGVPWDLFHEHLAEVYRLAEEPRDRVLRLLPRVATLVSYLAETGPTPTAAAAPLETTTRSAP